MQCGVELSLVNYAVFIQVNRVEYLSAQHALSARTLSTHSQHALSARTHSQHALSGCTLSTHSQHALSAVQPQGRQYTANKQQMATEQYSQTHTQRVLRRRQEKHLPRDRISTRLINRSTQELGHRPETSLEVLQGHPTRQIVEEAVVVELALGALSSEIA